MNTVFLVGVSLMTEPMAEDHVDKFVEGSKIPLEEMEESQSETAAT